jgi:hypothetical protein
MLQIPPGCGGHRVTAHAIAFVCVPNQLSANELSRLQPLNRNYCGLKEAGLVVKSLQEVRSRRPVDREAVDRYKRQMLVSVIARQLHALREERSGRDKPVPS